MSDDVDRASEREALFLADALRDQARRAGLGGKTVDDSAHCCVRCDEPIAQARRRALPGVQTCVHCAALAERAYKKGPR